MVDGPWHDVPDLWKDERAYLNWLRGQIRRVWSRHPLKHRYIASKQTIAPVFAREAGYPIGCTLTARTKKLRQCEMCEEWFPPSKLEVDHIHGGEGFTSYDEFLLWQHRMLFVTFDDLRLLCKDKCHAKVTLSQKLGCSMEEVPMHLERIEFGKLKAKFQCERLMGLGLPTGTNAKERERIFLTYYLEKKYGIS